MTDSRPPLTPTGEPCLDCGRAVVWYADVESGESLERIELWMRVSENNAVYFLCPTCFILRAEAKGISEIWRLSPTLGTALKGEIMNTHLYVLRHGFNGLPVRKWPRWFRALQRICQRPARWLYGDEIGR